MAKRFAKRSEAIRLAYTNNGLQNVEVKKYSVVRLLDVWASFCRDLILISSAGRCRTRSGRIILKTTLGSIENASRVARTNLRGKIGNEPRWHDATVALGVVQSLRPVNSAEICAAIGAVGSPADAVRIVRNHFAHESSKDCWAKFADGAWPNGRKAQSIWEYLEEPEIGGRRRIDQWIDDLQNIAVAAVN